MQEIVENLFLAEEEHQKIALPYVKVLIIIMMAASQNLKSQISVTKFEIFGRN